MEFKSSAFIFVTGFVLFVIGGFINVFGVSGYITWSLSRSIYSSGSNGGAIMLILLGSALALTGLIQMCIGAYRALSKLDALPVPAAVEQQSVSIPALPSSPPASAPAQV